MQEKKFNKQTFNAPRKKSDCNSSNNGGKGERTRAWVEGVFEKSSQQRSRKWRDRVEQEDGIEDEEVGSYNSLCEGKKMGTKSFNAIILAPDIVTTIKDLQSYENLVEYYPPKKGACSHNK